MKTFKKFIQENYVVYGYRSSLVVEELLPHQKKIVDQWQKTGKAEAISRHVIPPGQNSISIPLESPEDTKPVEPHPMVKAHLEKHGYDVHDYKAGLALEPESKKPVPEGKPKPKRRPVKIGAALEKTGAPEEVKHAFITDPKRSASRQAKKGGIRVMISRDPYHVAGMSTNQGWTSCMNMESGCNKHFLKNDVTEGTHVAYLYDHDKDPEAKNPLSRIALKPFNSEEGSHTVLRPEGTYGTADSAFQHTVSNWASKNFPVDDNLAYKKNENVYHDSGPQMIASFQRMITHSDPSVRANAFSVHSDKITEKDIDDALAKKDKRLHFAAIQHPRFSEKHIDHVLSNPNLYNADVRTHAMRNPNVSVDNITKGLQDESGDVRAQALFNPKANQKHLEMAWKDRHPYIRGDVLAKPGVNPEYFKQAKNDKSAHVRSMALTYDPSVKKEDLIGVMENEPSDVMRIAAVNHPLADKDILDRAVYDNSLSVRTELLFNKNVDRDHINALLADPYLSVRRQAEIHPLAPQNPISLAFNRSMAKLNRMRRGLPL